MLHVARLAATLGALLVAQAVPAIADEPNLPREKVELVAPPFVHPHEQATKSGPKIIEFRLVVQEKPMVIDNQGTTIQAMTFNGSIPGPMMVVHQNDYVEVTLVNPATNTMAHNIDFTPRRARSAAAP
jgi:nitrite reductase (NO-forming)